MNAEKLRMWPKNNSNGGGHVAKKSLICTPDGMR